MTPCTVCVGYADAKPCGHHSKDVCDTCPTSCPRCRRQVAEPIPKRSLRAQIFADIDRERERQNAKFPGQVLPDVFGPIPRNRDALTKEDRAMLAAATASTYRLPTEAQAKKTCDNAHKDDHLTWFDVLIEEVVECVEPAVFGDLEHLREEIVQVAAVCVRQIEDLDRRLRERLTKPDPTT